MTRPKIIFFGNGPLADYALPILEAKCEVLFHARTKEDLEEVKELKSSDQTDEIFGVLASFGVLIKPDLLELFEPAGILNIHPSLLPKYRGPSPIETAIKNGDKEFGVSVMKLAKAMDAGPIYYQTHFSEKEIFSIDTVSFNDASDYKDTIYQKLAECGAHWIAKNLSSLPVPTPQDEKAATFSQKLDKSLSALNPEKKTAEQLLDEIRAFSGFPKSKYDFFSLECTIINAHVSDTKTEKDLFIPCKDGKYLIIDMIQPAGRKIMDARSFINGYKK